MTESSMDKAAPIAVVIPCYNYGRFVGDAIESVLNQTLPVAEVLVVDDGSTDDTADVCSRYASVRYIRQENGGVSSARNRGIRESTSQYLMFPDADDLLLPSAIETLWKARQRTPQEVKALFGWAKMFDNAPNAANDASSQSMPRPDDMLPYVAEQVSEDLWRLSDRILERLVKSNIVAQCSAIIERSVYREIGEWDCRFRYHQDRDIWLRIAAACPLYFVNQPVSQIRRHDDNITHNKNWIRNHTEILELLDAAATGSWASPMLRELAKSQFASSAYFLGQRLADSGNLLEARRMMAAAIRRRPFRPKPLVRWMQYLIGGVVVGPGGQSS